MVLPRLQKLPETEVDSLSGPVEDVSRSLDAQRSWLTVQCDQCGAQAVVEEPAPEASQEGYIADEVEAVLPDGRKIAVTGVPMVRDVRNLSFTCNQCGKKQEAEF